MRFVIALAATWLALALDGDPHGGTDDGGLWVHVVQHDQPATSSHGAPKTHEVEAPPVLIGGGACDAAEHVAGAILDVTFCPGGSPQPALTLGDIRAAFARLPLPPSRLVIQPPGGRTLVNFATNFYTTDTEPILREVTLLGRRVTIRATPSSYAWTFGDGRSRTTSSPGAAYPELAITHAYAHHGRFRPHLATTYRGEFRVGAQGWRQIPGTVTIAGPSQPLRVVEAIPHLVGH